MALTKVRGGAVDGGTISTETAGTNNLILGSTAGDSIASGGSSNVCIGDTAGTAITTGDLNTFVGMTAGATVATNSSNTAVGAFALDAGDGDNNTAIGAGAFGGSSFSSNHNTAVGKDAGNALTTGANNTFVGSRAALSATTADSCVIVGEQAAGGATLTGADNTCVGFAAGYALTSGTNNALLGHNAGRSGSPSGDLNTGSNAVVLGDDNITSLFCADTSISSSDSRDKADVTDFNIGLNWVKDLRPVTYKWDKRTWYGTEEEPYGTPDGSKKKSKVNIGFLAQEVLEVEKANGFADSKDTMLTCNLTDDGQRYGMKYERLVPVLVNAIKELSAKNDALEARIKKLEDG